MSDQPQPAIQSVDDLQVASLRFQGQRADAPAAIADLRAAVGDLAAGPPILLMYYGGSPEKRDYEACLPVRAPVATETITTRLLPGETMLVLTHDGPATATPDSWGILWRYISAGEVVVRDMPPREVYLADGRIALQLPLHHDYWLRQLSDGLEAVVGPEGRQHVIGDGAGLRPDAPPEQRAAWARGMIDRLEVTVADEADRQRIMAGCAHVFPAHIIEALRAEYLRLGEDLDALLAHMRETGFYGAVPEREGDRLIVTKVPANLAAYEATSDPVEKRAAYCHCGMIRAAIRADDSFPTPTYCYCGSGWFTRLWDNVLGQPVRVEVVDSVLQGGETCTFAIVLPEEF